MRLGDIITVNPESIRNGYPFDEIEYIDISSVGTGTLQGTQRLQIGAAPSRAKRIVRNGDTLLATVRPNLRSFWFARNPQENTIASTGFAVLRAGKDIDVRFLYFTVTNQPFTDYLTANAKGSAYPAVDTDTIERAEIFLPPFPTQRKIAAILSAYDDLIENNLRRIKILEEMAQNLYREWFVKFRFPGHQHARFTDSPLGRIPEGWKVSTLGAVSNVIPGYAFKSKDWADAGIPVIKIKNIRPGNLIDTEQVDHVPDGILSSTHKKYWLSNGDILIAMTGATAGKVGKLRSKRPMLLNQRVAKIEPKKHFSEFVWCTVSSPGAEERFYALADGAAQPNMSGGQIENCELLVPSAALVQQFNKFMSPFVNDVDNMILRNQTLRRTRDLLLPRLISGEVDVSEMDIAVPVENEV